MDIMPDPTNPFFDPEFVDQVLPASLSDHTEPIFNSGKFLLPCAGSQLINALFAHFQEQALHLTYTILTQNAEFHLVDGKMVAFFPEPKSSAAMLTPADRERTLFYLSAVMTLCAVEIGPTVSDAAGMTTPKPDRTFAHFAHFTGCGSTITVNPRKIEKINEAFANNQPIAQQLYIFELAVLLFHEVAHVIVCAVHSSGNCFLGNAQANEIGYEYEHRLFGGLIQMDRGFIHGPNWSEAFPHTLVQREWPHPHTVDLYRNALNVDPILCRGAEPDRVTRVWRVPFLYINQMFQDRFWMLLPGVGANALHLRRNWGVLVVAMKLEDYGRLLYRYLHWDEPIRAGWVPVGFVLERNGLVRRIGG